MNETDRTAFYIGALRYRDLDSDDVDAILSAHGLSTRANTADECRAVIDSYMIYTPGGPIVNWQELYEKTGWPEV